jgi:hypothetical protein
MATRKDHKKATDSLDKPSQLQALPTLYKINPHSTT